MSGDFAENLGRMFGGLKRRAEETLARQQAAFVLGKIPGVDVSNDFGVVLAKAGEVVTPQILAECERSGKLGALASAVAKGVAQDLTETTRQRLGALPENQENRSIEDLDDYLAARACIGKVVGVNVSDVRGNILIPAGTALQDEHVRLTREAGQLGALLYAVSQPFEGTQSAARGPQKSEEYTPKPEAPPASRTTLPMPPPADPD